MLYGCFYKFAGMILMNFITKYQELITTNEKKNKNKMEKANYNITHNKQQTNQNKTKKNSNEFKLNIQTNKHWDNTKHLVSHNLYL